MKTVPFMDFELNTKDAAFRPRFETELLVEKAAGLFSKTAPRAINVLDRIGKRALPLVEAMKRAGMKGRFPADYLSRMAKYVPAGLVGGK